MAGKTDHWARRHRSKDPGSLRACKNRRCKAPNRPHRTACWKCGEPVGAQPFKSSYWHEQRRRQEEAINVTHTKHTSGTAIASPSIKAEGSSPKSRKISATYQTRVELLA